MDPKDEIKNAIDIVDYIGQVVKLQRAGRNFKGLCPFHSEKSPSFMVSSERQTFKCFGCDEGGDIYSFYMKREGVTFPEALRDLAKVAQIELTDYQPPKDFEKKLIYYEINQAASKLYNYILKDHKIGAKAKQYLAGRGITESQISSFQLGYAPDSWQTITSYLTKKKSYRLEDVVTTGLTLKSQGGSSYDRFRGRIIFPLQDARGNIVGFSGRVLPWTEDDKSGKYINSPETPIYHKSQLLYPLYLVRDAVRKANQIIIVEGELDALSSIRIGVRNCVAVKGSALTEDQVRLIKRFADTIILALDADESGIKAAKRAIQVAQAKDIQVKVIYIAEGKDPDDLIRHDPKSWKKLVKSAMSVYDFFIQMALQQNDPKTIEGKQAITTELLPILNQIENKVVQDHYAHKLARSLSVQPDIITQEMDRVGKSSRLGRLAPPKKQLKNDEKAIPRPLQFSDELLHLTLSNYSELDLLTLPISDFPINAATKVLKKLADVRPQDLTKFAKALSPELQETFDNAYLREETVIPEANKLRNRWQKAISDLAILHLRDKLRGLRAQFKSEKQDSDLGQKINQVLEKLRFYES